MERVSLKEKMKRSDTMKRGVALIRTGAAVMMMAMTVASCGLLDNQETPQGYVKHCMRIIDRYALYADQPEWKEKKQEVAERVDTLSGMENARNLVREALAVAGGKHSGLSEPVRDTTQYEETAPQMKMLDGGIAYVLLPAHMGVKVSDREYIHSVLDFLCAHYDASGVVVDLRDNNGGNMYPMIASVAPLLPNKTLIRFRQRKKSVPIYFENIEMVTEEKVKDIGKFESSVPVALLTDNRTASSGEATLLCFRGLENTRVFGTGTAGYASANMVFTLADGYNLIVTSGCDVARTDEVFCDDPIEPDVETETPLEDALQWIESRQ